MLFGHAQHILFMVIWHWTQQKTTQKSERILLQPPRRLLFQISSKGSFICIIPQHLLPVVGHWMEREIAQCVHHEGSIRRPIADTLTTELHLAPVLFWHHCISIKRTNYFSNPHQKRGNFTRLQRQMTHKKTQTHSPHNRVQISKEMTQLPREITKQNSCQGR